MLVKSPYIPQECRGHRAMQQQRRCDSGKFDDINQQPLFDNSEHIPRKNRIKADSAGKYASINWTSTVQHTPTELHVCYMFCKNTEHTALVVDRRMLKTNHFN